MHFVALKLKRAFHRSLAFGKAQAAPFGLTPARFDLLYVLHTAPRGKRRQSYLRRALGVCAMTVSRMVRRLEELGLVTRSVSVEDERQRNVYITADARWRIRAILKRLVRPGVFRDAYQRAFGGPSKRAFWKLDAVYLSIFRLSRHFGDSSFLWYPTGFPDD